MRLLSSDGRLVLGVLSLVLGVVLSRGAVESLGVLRLNWSLGFCGSCPGSLVSLALLELWGALSLTELFAF